MRSLRAQLGAQPVDGAPPSPTRPVPLWHLAPIALLLLMASVFVGYDGYVFIDEAAFLAQVELVGDGSWTVGRPLADADPDGAWVPMARSTLTDDGFAPFPNHPLHVLVATAADQVGGHVGIRLLSVLGVLGASAAAAFLAASVSIRHAVAAMWITGVTSPLLFDANLVVGHALAAAATGAALVLLFQDPMRRTPSGLVLRGAAVAGLVAAGVLLRSEVVLLGSVAGVFAFVRAARDRSRPGLVTGMAAVAGAVAAYVVEPWWIDQLVGESPGRKVIASSSRGGVDGMLRGARTVLVGLGGSGTAVVVVVVLAAATALVLRRRPADAGPAVVLAAGAATMAIVHATEPAIVPGIAWAFPLLAVGLVAGSGSAGWPTAIRWAGAAAGLFALVVLVTQYEVGGGTEWGWRYVAVVLPVVGAGLSVPVVHLAELPGRPARLAVAAVAVAVVAVPLSGLVSQRRAVERVGDLLDRTDAALASSDADLVVAAEPSFGRFAWPQSIAGDVVTVGRGEAELARLFGALDRQGVDRVLLVWDGTEPAVPSAAAEPVGEAVVLLKRAYSARAFDL